MAHEGVRSVANESETADQSHHYPLVRSDPANSLARRTDPQVRRAPSSGNLYDVLDLILDKGIVIDAFVRVSVVGIELLTIDARVVIASVDTYLRYAKAAERLNIYERDDSANLKEMTQGGKSKVMEKGAEKAGRALTGEGAESDDQDDEDQEEEGVGGRLAHGVRHVLKRGVGRIMEKLSGEEGDEDDDKNDDEERSSGRKQLQKHGRDGGGGEKGDRGRHHAGNGSGKSSARGR